VSTSSFNGGKALCSGGRLLGSTAVLLSSLLSRGTHRFPLGSAADDLAGGGAEFGGRFKILRDLPWDLSLVVGV